MAAKIRIKRAFRKTDLVTNIKLHNAVDDAYVRNIDQTNVKASSGLIYNSTSAPADTDALHNDKSDYSLKSYDGSNWQTCIDTNDVRNYSGESSGYMQGVWMHAYQDKLRVTPGTLAIGKNLCTNTETIEVDLSVEWNSNSTVGGYDSTLSDNTAIYPGVKHVFAVSNERNSSFNILLATSSPAPPDYATPGVDARYLGVISYSTDLLSTTYPEGAVLIGHARPYGFIMNSQFNVNVPTASVGVAINSFPATFDNSSPNVIATFYGRADNPLYPGTDYKIDAFTNNVEDIITSVYDVGNLYYGTSTYGINISRSSGADLPVGIYGYFILALGSWTIAWT